MPSIVELIIERFREANERVTALKTSINGVFEFIVWSLRDVIKDINTEEEFLKLVAELIDELVKLPAPYEWFDEKIASVILRVLDKHILDHFLGADWFKKMKAKVENAKE